MIAAWIIFALACIACTDLVFNGDFSDMHDCISGTVWTTVLFSALSIIIWGAGCG